MNPNRPKESVKGVGNPRTAGTIKRLQMYRCSKVIKTILCKLGFWAKTYGTSANYGPIIYNHYSDHSIAIVRGEHNM